MAVTYKYKSSNIYNTDGTGYNFREKDVGYSEISAYSSVDPYGRSKFMIQSKRKRRINGLLRAQIGDANHLP